MSVYNKKKEMFGETFGLIVMALIVIAGSLWCLGISNTKSGVEAEIASAEIKTAGAQATAEAQECKGPFVNDIARAICEGEINPDEAYKLMQDPDNPNTNDDGSYISKGMAIN